MDGPDLLFASTVIAYQFSPSWRVAGISKKSDEAPTQVILQNETDTSGQAYIFAPSGLFPVPPVPPQQAQAPHVQWHIANNGYPPSAVTGHPGLGDFDADGLADLLWQNSDGTPGIWLINSGVSGVGRWASDTFANPGTSWHVIGSGDFNGDGRRDMLWQNNNGQAAIWFMDSLTKIGDGLVGDNPGTDWHAIAAGDFNGDAKADIVWRNGADGRLAIWLLNGTGVQSTAVVVTNPGTDWQTIGTGDFNHDGKADILMQNTVTGDAAVWLMNGTSQIGGGTVASSPGTTWHVKGAGDFDGDGKSDILWQDDSSQVALWFMDGATRLSSATLPSTLGAGWTVKGAADFNGDGKADIVWQHDASGAPNLWLMSGTSILSQQSTFQTPGGVWHLITNAG